MITILELSRALKLDKSTVSRGLRDHPRVSRATRDRIKAKATEMGYIPNPAMSAIASRRFARGRTVSLVGFLNDRPPPDRGNLPRERSVTQVAAMEEAQRLGYETIEFRAHRFPDGRAVVREMERCGVCALVASQWAQMSDGLADPDLLAPYVCAATNPIFSRWGYRAVGVDVFDGLLTIWREVRARGYRRVGFALFQHQPVHPDDLLRNAAAALCQEESGPEDRVPSFHFHQMRPIQMDALADWFRKEQPEAIIGFNNIIANALKQRGVRVPEDVAFASMVGSDRLTSEFATVHFFDQDIGAEAARQVDLMLKVGDFGLHPNAPITRVPVLWQEGASLPDRSRAPAGVP